MHSFATRTRQVFQVASRRQDPNNSNVDARIMMPWLRPTARLFTAPKLVLGQALLTKVSAPGGACASNAIDIDRTEAVASATSFHCARFIMVSSPVVVLNPNRLAMGLFHSSQHQS